jgi:hypothetical protein
MSDAIPQYLLAAMPSTITIEGEFVVDKPSLEASAVGGEGRARTFNGVGYSGGALKQWWSRYPLVVDLAAMNVSRQRIPLQYSHDSQDPDSLLGQTASIENTGKNLRVSGSFYPDGRIRDHVVARADQGHEWQLSIGADPQGIHFVEAGQKIEVNGVEWTGPVNVVRPSTLRELSVVRLGADANTHALVASLYHQQKGLTMATPATTNDGGTPSQTTPPVAASAVPPVPPPVTTPPVQAQAPAPAPVQAGATDPNAAFAAITATLEAQGKALAAITDRLTKQDTAEGLRAGRPTAPNGFRNPSFPEGVDENQIKAAAICMNLGMKDDKLEATFGAENFDGTYLSAKQVEVVLEAAHKHRRRYSLHSILIEAARQNGYDGEGYRVHQGNIDQVLRASFSTHQVGNLLGTAYGKFALQAFTTPEDPFEEIMQEIPVEDYKEVTGVRAGGDFRFKPLTNAGKIEDAELADEIRSIGADLFARMTSATLKDIANDNLGRISQIGTDLGTGAKIAFLEDFWKQFEASNSSYFTAVTPGAGNALSLASLDIADTTFCNAVDAFGNKAIVEPNLLLTPAALKNTAAELMQFNTIVSGNTNARVNGNIYAGRYRPIYSRYLTSTTTWWLIGRQGTLAAMNTAYVGGQRTPIIQSADADFNTLGIQFRGYFPWGNKKAEKLTCVRMATA